MKKINLAILSIMTLIFGVVLSACTFKKVDANFTQSEVAVSVGQPILLDDYLTVKEIEKKDVKYQFSNSSIFEIEDRKVTAMKSGKSFVYATYQNNNLASMQIVVKNKFEVPTDFSLSNDGTLTWNVSLGCLENEAVPTKAESYLVQGTCKIYSSVNPMDVVSIENINFDTINSEASNSYKLPYNGEYELTVTAKGADYFEASDPAKVPKLYWGYTEAVTDLQWTTDGQLTWTDDKNSNVKYKIKFDDVVLPTLIQTTTVNLAETFDNATSGIHRVSVFAIDDAGKKIARESEILSIEKFEQPTTDYVYSSENGGQFELSSQKGVQQYQFLLYNGTNTQTYTIENTQTKVSTVFEGLDAQVYDAQVYVMATSGLYYQSDKKSIGKIYKLPTLIIEGVGDNVENGTKFKFGANPDFGNTGETILTESLLGIKVVSAEGKPHVDFEQFELGTSFEASVMTSGKHNLTTYLLPASEQNQISGQEVFVLNGDLSNALEVTKVSAFAEGVVHSHNAEGKSTFEFEKVDGATKYMLLYNDGSEFVEVDNANNSKYMFDDSGEKNKIIFVDKIENIFDAVNVEGTLTYEFKLVAITDENELAITSSIPKTLTELSAPTTANSGNSTDSAYKWTPVEKADGYELEIYEIDKETYTENQTELTINLTGATKVETTTAEYVFDKEGYYFVKVFALAKGDSVNDTISSKECLCEVFYIAKQLEVGTFNFGYNADFVNYSDFTTASGYYIEIENSENVDSYDVSISDGNSTLHKISSGENSVYLLAENFANESTEIVVSAMAKSTQDSTIYQDSDTQTLTIVRLARVSYADVVIDELTTGVTIRQSEGVTGISITDATYGDTVNVTATDATMPIEDKTNFELKVILKGSTKEGNLYQASNGKVYLDSPQSTLNFSRLATPTELQYYNQKLTFEHTAVANIEHYVLDILCTTAEGQQKIAIILGNAGTTAKAKFNGTTFDFQQDASIFRTTTSNVTTIDVHALISTINASPLRDYYAQTTEVGFEVYGYVKRTEANGMILSTLPATLEGSTTDTTLKIEKVEKGSLTMQQTETDYVLNWEEINVSTDATKNALTTYEIFSKNSSGEFEKVTEVSGTTTYSLPKTAFDIATVYEYYIKAKNPYYLDSNNSNIVRFYKLQSVQSVTLTLDGNLNLRLVESEEGYIENIKLTTADGSTQTISNKIVEDLASGTYQFVVVGKTIDEIQASGVISYYIDSNSASWTLADMSTIKADVETISYTNNVLSWNAFGQNNTLSTLVYYLIFKDVNDQTAIYETTALSADLKNNSELSNIISALSAGDISVEVVACLKPYTAVAGQTVYFSDAKTLLNSNTLYNVEVYETTATVKKLTTPVVTKVEFVYDNDDTSDSYLSDAFTPKIMVTFEGNYLDGDNFSVFVDDDATPAVIGKISNQADAESVSTTFEIALNNNFNEGEIKKLSINVFGDTSMPSSKGSVDIGRAYDIEEIEFLVDDDLTVTQTLNVTLDTTNIDCLAGGLVLKFDITSGGNATTVYKKYQITGIDADESTLDLNLTEIFETYLEAGGSIKVSAFINSYANDDNKSYYLASPNMCECLLQNALKAVSSENISREEGGFTIDSTLNNVTSYYMVEYGEEKHKVEYNVQTNKFYFEIPNEWTDSTYNLTIYACEENYISSLKNNINFEVSRIDAVKEVSIQRTDVDDLSSVTMAWEAVAGATGYIIRVYDSVSDSDNVLLSYQTADTKATLAQIFGQHYQKLIDNGFNVLNFNENHEFSFEIITIGNATKNNSYTYSFDAKIVGNDILNYVNPQDVILVDEYGIINFASEVGKSYLYRFVDAGGTQLSKWTQIDAVSETSVVDASVIDKEVLAERTAYNLEIIVLGTATENANSTSSDFEISFDSLYMTTVGKDLTFIINDAIASIGCVEELPSSFAFTMTTSSFTKIYAGFGEDSLANHEVVEFVPEDPNIVAGAAQNIYSYSALDLIDLFVENGYEFASGETTIYFWSYRETPAVTSSYTISRNYALTFNLDNNMNFVEIKKMGINDGENTNFDGLTFAENYEDYANAYAIFANTDNATSVTMGMYIKIHHLDEVVDADQSQNAETKTTTKFLSKIQLADEQYFDSSVFVVNLTKIFEESDLVNLTGRFKVEFAKLEYSNEQFVVYDWFSTDADGREFVFERLPQIKALTISAGNLTWLEAGENATRYYVYFSEDETVSEKYSYHPTTTTFFDASTYVGENDIYYVAVQSISEDIYKLPSSKVFVMNGTEKAQVYKNQIKNPIKLVDGKLVIDWSVEDDFYNALMSTDEAYMIAEYLATTTFTAPFTFTLDQLLNNNIKIRFKFTKLGQESAGISEYIDVNAKHLLANLYDFDSATEQKLKDVYQNAPSADGVNQLIGKFVEFVEKGSHGIANISTIFDDVFEKLQMGGYKMEYCLVGSGHVLASRWYQFTNDNGANALYVNAEPYIKAIPESHEDKAMNSYKILIQKSQVYGYDGTDYTLQDAQNYVFKISGEKDYAFAIIKILNSYSMYLLGSDMSKKVSVYTVNENGEESLTGDYLMFYINHNDGDSILGQFGDELLKVTYKMQIYAVGNNYSASSKSSYFNLVLLGFGQNMRVVDGTFSWTAQINRPTSVIYMREGSKLEEEIGISGEGLNASFSLENFGAGTYTYLKFVMKGEIKGNTIFVDSEIYQVNNVQKLYAPNLSNVLGEINIDDSDNVDGLETCFVPSDAYAYNFMITNDKAGGAHATISSETQNVSYQVGTTGMSEDNPDYNYKATETSATKFYVSSLGTTASLSPVRDTTDYYKYTLYCVMTDATETTDAVLSTKNIAIRSEAQEFDGQMLDTPQNLRIEEGLLKWNAVSKKTGEPDLSVPTENNIKTIYKLTVEKYKISNIEAGSTETNVMETAYYYTANVYFDFALLEELSQEFAEQTYLKVTLQALALQTVNSQYQGSIRLVEGGYAYGDISYNGTTIKILKSNGATINRIDRLKAIDEGSLRVYNGKLRWTYTTDLSVTEANFFEVYDFVVADADGKEIAGNCTVSVREYTEDTTKFNVEFVEEKGSMSEGINTFYVYAIQGSKNANVVTKSLGRSIEAVKLESVESEDYMVYTENSYEVFDLSNYFANNSTNIVEASLVLNGDTQTAKMIVFTNTKAKLYIFTESQIEVAYPSDFVNDYIVVGAQDVLDITFKAKPAINDTVSIYSDESDKFTLQRATISDSTIEWDDETQQFTWEYNGMYSFDKDVRAKSMARAYMLASETTLYVDETLNEQSGISLKKDTVIEIEEILQNSTKIAYNSQSYYISNNAYQEGFAELGDETIASSTLFKIEQELGDETIVSVGSDVYKVSSADVTKPIYTITATYGENTNQVVRLYTTTETHFKPTIVGKVGISVKVKLGEGNLQSQELIYVADGTQPAQVEFDLFASGDGSSANPYVISNAEQFNNITYRMTKEDYLKAYVANGNTIDDNDVFHFSIVPETDATIDLGKVNGVVLSGTFDGVISAGERAVTIKYWATNVSKLTNPITVKDGNVLSSSTASETTYLYGASLFETLATTAQVSNINLEVVYANEEFDIGTGSYKSMTIATDSLIAGLAITNNGLVSNVNMTNFTNLFCGYNPGGVRVVMVYSGICAINSGTNATISNCQVLTDMYVSDLSKAQVIFVSGIAYTNHATIESCVAGASGNQILVDCQAKTDTVQVAGIAITNTTSASIRNCTNNMAIQVNASVEATNNAITVFIAKIADMGAGTLTGNILNGSVNTVNILETRRYWNVASNYAYATTERP